MSFSSIASGRQVAGPEPAVCAEPLAEPLQGLLRRDGEADHELRRPGGPSRLGANSTRRSNRRTGRRSSAGRDRRPPPPRSSGSGSAFARCRRLAARRRRLRAAAGRAELVVALPALASLAVLAPRGERDVAAESASGQRCSSRCFAQTSDDWSVARFIVNS